jgi:hypothetical protein
MIDERKEGNVSFILLLNRNSLDTADVVIVKGCLIIPMSQI